jgi:hypothetical protein|tara:strand:- start:49 stop:429 length:381 start_codon:yes stop_codon:yes gene_type:complete
MKENLPLILQLIISVGLINVWLFRFNKVTEYRGGGANNMKEEFQAYGLPIWLMYVVGFLKIAIAIMLIVSIWIKELLEYNLWLLSVLMFGAVLMHLKVKDPIKKSYPALSILFMIALILYLSMPQS